MITLRIEGLDELKSDFARGVEEIPGEIRAAMVQATGRVQIRARELAPYKRGNLRQSIFTEIQDNGFKGIVGQDATKAKYGIYQEYGTQPYVILPVTKKALYWKGALHPVRVVNHPGIKAHPFMQPAFDENIDKIQEIFEKAVDNIINVIAKR